MRKPVLSVLGLIVIAATTFAASGCVQKPPPVIPTDKPSAAPVFKTDAEALAAARETYNNYLKVSDAVGNDGGTDSARLLSVVTQSWYPTEAKDYKALLATGNRYSGSSSFSDFKMQDRDEDARGNVSVGVYACLDISKSKTFTSAGKDVTPKGRIELLPLELSFVSNHPHSSALLLDRSEPWNGPNFCR
jgi:hypothetical protein